jgi:hypothetical protein
MGSFVYPPSFLFSFNILLITNGIFSRDTCDNNYRYACVQEASFMLHVLTNIGILLGMIDWITEGTGP